jgi:prophage regulatory protein
MSGLGLGPLAILRRKQVEERTGLSRSSIYKRMRDGTFPPAVPLGGRMVGWRVSDIERFLENPARYRAPRATASGTPVGGCDGGR